MLSYQKGVVKNFGAASGRIFISRWRYYDGILGKCQPGGNA